MNQQWFSTRQVIAYTSAAILFLGIFVPLWSALTISVSLISWSTWAGLLGFVVVGGTIITAALKKFEFLWVTVGASVLAIILAVVRLETAKPEANASLGELEDNPFASLAQGVVDSIQLDWGIALWVLGAVLAGIAASSLLSKRTRTGRKVKS